MTCLSIAACTFDVISFMKVSLLNFAMESDFCYSLMELTYLASISHIQAFTFAPDSLLPVWDSLHPLSFDAIGQLPSSDDIMHFAYAFALPLTLSWNAFLTWASVESFVSTGADSLRNFLPLSFIPPLASHISSSMDLYDLRSDSFSAEKLSMPYCLFMAATSVALSCSVTAALACLASSLLMLYAVPNDFIVLQSINFRLDIYLDRSAIFSGVWTALYVALESASSVSPYWNCP